MPWPISREKIMSMLIESNRTQEEISKSVFHQCWTATCGSSSRGLGRDQRWICNFSRCSRTDPARPFPSPHDPIAANRVKQYSYHNRQYCGVPMIRQIVYIVISYCRRQKINMNEGNKDELLIDCINVDSILYTS